MTPKFLPQSDPLLFSFLSILDAANFNAHFYAPRESNLTGGLSLLPPDNALLPAFSYAALRSQKIGNGGEYAAHEGKLIMDIEAAMWVAKKTATSEEEHIYFPWTEHLYQDTEHHSEGIDITPAFLLSESLNLAGGTLRTTIEALDAKTPRIDPQTGEQSTRGQADNWLVKQYGFKRLDNPLIRYYFKDVSGGQLYGASATFKIIMKDWQSDYCSNVCGFNIDMAQLSSYHINRKYGIRNYTDPIQ